MLTCLYNKLLTVVIKIICIKIICITIIIIIITVIINTNNSTDQRAS
jgi:hypothetical protein